MPLWTTEMLMAQVLSLKESGSECLFWKLFFSKLWDVSCIRLQQRVRVFPYD